MPITPYSHIQHTLWQTDDKLGSRDALPERVEAALQAFQALAYDSSFGHWFKFSLFERLWQITKGGRTSMVNHRPPPKRFDIFKIALRCCRHDSQSRRNSQLDRRPPNRRAPAPDQNTRPARLRICARIGQRQRELLIQ